MNLEMISQAKTCLRYREPVTTWTRKIICFCFLIILKIFYFNLVVKYRHFKSVIG